MADKHQSMTKRSVLAYLKKNIPGLDELGITSFQQLEELVEEKQEAEFCCPSVDPVLPPERPVRVIHNGHTVKVPKPVVLVDTREREEFVYTFDRFTRWFADIERATLRVGDYTIKGLEDRLVIERKSLADLVNSVIGNRGRFLTQCKRMAAVERKAIVIEASLAQVKSPYEESRAHPNAVVGSLWAAQERWGIQIVWADTPELAEETTAHILSKYYTLHWLKQNKKPRHFVDGDV